MRRTLAVLVVTTAAVVAATGLGPAPGVARTVSPGADAPGSATSAPSAARTPGAPGRWTQVSTGTVGITFEASMFRTADDVAHLVYPKEVSGGPQLGHTAIRANGTTARQNNVLPGPWSIVETTPAVIGGAGGGLRVVFGGAQSTAAGFWSNGRMYTLTAPASGASWTLPMESVGQSGAAYGSYGTSGVALADGTPVAGYPLNSDIVWHVGTGTDPDSSFTVASCCVYDTTMVRSGSEVWIGWYGNGSSPATNGTFVRRIIPSLGPITKAPGSSVGSDSVPTGRVALAARAGGGVYAAYCQGYPTCDGLRLWKVGNSRALALPQSRYAAALSLAAAPSGRLWLAFSDNIPKVRAVRTNRAATRFGAVRVLGMPRGRSAVYSLVADGGTGRGDVVVNVGDAFWHTQALAGLTLRAAPGGWRAGSAQRVVFTVVDAGEDVAGARVAVGSRRCTTSSRGTCAIAFPRGTGPGRLTARATKTGYAAGTQRLTVRRAGRG